MATAQEHLQAAERLLSDVSVVSDPDYTTVDVTSAILALAHATIALAVEVGVPHGDTQQGGGSGG